MPAEPMTKEPCYCNLKTEPCHGNPLEGFYCWLGALQTAERRAEDAESALAEARDAVPHYSNHFGTVAKSIDDMATRLAVCGRALLFAENHCPCGARPESLKTHPHIGGCLIENALRSMKGPAE